jgi:thioesterase domain-containing protein
MSISEILKQIKPYETLGMKVENENTDSFTMSIPLNENINDKNTMFAGSIYSVMVLCGWALAYEMLNHDAKAYNIVIKQSHIDYVSPVQTGAQAIARLNGNIITKTNGNKSIQVTVNLKDSDDKSCAEFTGEYIGIRM